MGSLSTYVHTAPVSRLLQAPSKSVTPDACPHAQSVTNMSHRAVWCYKGVTPGHTGRGRPGRGTPAVPLLPKTCHYDNSGVTNMSHRAVWCYK
eukprot:1185207-Prorocentrum_minimum.AAC.6